MVILPERTKKRRFFLKKTRRRECSPPQRVLSIQDIFRNFCFTFSRYSSTSGFFIPSRMAAYAATEPSTAARMQMRLGRASALTPVQTRTMPTQPQSTEPTVRRSAETVTKPLEQRMQSIMEHSSASRVVKAAAFSRNRGMSRMKSGFFLVAHMRLSSKEQKFLQKNKPFRAETDTVSNSERFISLL